MKIFDLSRIIRAGGYSLRGLRHALTQERAFQQELALSILLIPLAFVLTPVGLERALLISAVFLALIVEILNTGLEVLVNRISTDQHPLSGLAKDLGSAAVFLALLNAAVVWALVLLA